MLQALSSISSSERSYEIARFLGLSGINADNVAFLAADMSSRTYHRAQQGGRTFVVMDAPTLENVDQFIAVATFLRTHGIHAPEIIAKDLIQGFILLEDFGDQTFTKIMQRDPSFEKQKELYLTATDVLLKMHGAITEKPSFLGEYTNEALLKETEVFADYYWPYIHKNTIPDDIKAEWQSLWTSAFNDIGGLVPSSIVLRDYHVDNLMILSDGQCGVLDFQDALWGPVLYDVVSLTEDARLNVSEEIEALVWNRYLQNIDADLHPAYRFTGDVLSAGRHAKILGVFTRYLIKYNRDTKLHHLPHVGHLLKRSCKRAGLIGILDFLRRYQFEI